MMSLGSLMVNNKLSVGDVIEIPLPNGKNAYARCYQNSVLAFYCGYYDSYDELPLDTPYSFFASVFSKVTSDGVWKKVGSRPFINEDDIAPPTVMVDPFSGNGKLLVDGDTVVCTYEECKDSEPAVVWDRVSIVRRLLGENVIEPRMRPRPPEMSVEDWRAVANSPSPRSIEMEPFQASDSYKPPQPRILPSTTLEYEEQLWKIRHELEYAKEGKSTYPGGYPNGVAERLNLMRCLYAAGYDYQMLKQELSVLIEAAANDWLKGGKYGNPVYHFNYVDIYAWSWFLGVSDSGLEELFRVYSKPCTEDSLGEVVQKAFCFERIPRTYHLKKTGNPLLDKALQYVNGEYSSDKMEKAIVKASRSRDNYITIHSGCGMGLALGVAFILDVYDCSFDNLDETQGWPLDLIAHKHG